MTYFNKKEDVYHIELTPHGRYLLSIGKLNFKSYAFFDDLPAEKPNLTIEIWRVRGCLRAKSKNLGVSVSQRQAVHATKHADTAGVLGFCGWHAAQRCDEDAAAAARAGRRLVPPAPRHCSASIGPARACAAEKGVSQKQRNQMRVFASVTHSELPSEETIDAMSKEEAGQWIHERWTASVQHGRAARRGR